MLFVLNWPVERLKPGYTQTFLAELLGAYFLTRLARPR